MTQTLETNVKTQENKVLPVNFDAITIKSVKYKEKGNTDKEKGFFCSFSLKGQTQAETYNIEFHNSTDKPDHSFFDALIALAYDYRRFDDIISQDDIKITGLSLCRKDGNISKINLIAQRDIGLNSPKNELLNNLPIAPDEENNVPGFFEDGGEARLQKVLDETIKFMKYIDKRSEVQTSLFDTVQNNTNDDDLLEEEE